MTCGNSSRSTTVTNGSICCRVSCRITIFESIEWCDPLTYPRDNQKTLGYGVQCYKNCKLVQSGWLGTRKQVQDGRWKGLHAKLDHRGV